MSSRSLFRLMAVAFMILTAGLAHAQQGVPEARFIYSEDTDFPGGDLTTLFDTTQEACERACLAEPGCRAFTFNGRSNSCFPKSDATGQVPYAGAMSARQVATDTAVLQGAPSRISALSSLTDSDLTAAEALVARIARQFPAGAQNASDLSAALAAALAEQRIANARVLAGFLASRADTSAAWTALSHASLRLPKSLPDGERRQARTDAVPAAINGYLRARTDAEEAGALAQLAEAFEENGRGRDMIPALRRAYQLTGREDLSQRLDDAIGQYGFRITDHQIDSDSANPRICAVFSEPLIARGTDYDSFVRVPDARLVTSADGAQLCLEGVEHGQSYEVTFRSGLPSESGEELARDVTLRLYVRDRSPSVTFPGRAYVLPRLDGTALPVQTVNISEIELNLRAVSDRNLLRAIQESYFGRPLNYYEEQQFAEDVAAEVWSGTAQVQNELNRDMTTRLPLGEILAGRDPGIYALSARVPGADPYDAPTATQWFVLTDLGLTSMKGAEGLHVAVRGLADAAAKEGVRVTLISQANAVLGETSTDAEGFARFDAGLTRGSGSAAPALILAETDGDMAFLPLTGPAFDLSDRGVEGRPAPGPIDAFLATDRGAYRAGETVGVTALVRDDTALALPDLPVTAVLLRPDGAEYSRMTARQTAAGGHVFEMPLGADVPRGAWRLDLRLGDDQPALASRTVLVEDFLPERIDFTLDVPGDSLRLSDRPPLRIQADYLFGAPAADLAVEAELRLRPTRHLAGWPGFRFGPHDAPIDARTSWLEPGRTDASGAATLALDFPEIEAENMPLEAQIVARVSEGSGRPVERDMTLPVDAPGPLIGLKPVFEDVVQEGGEAAFQAVAIGPDGAALNGRLRWTLNRIETRYQWYQLYGEWNWEPTTRRSRVATGTVDLTGAPAAIATQVDWGEYELVAELQGGRSIGSVRFQAGWYGAGEGGETPDRLQVGLDRPDFVVGDTARLRVNAPSGGTALVSVLATDVIHQEVVTLDPGETVIPLQVTEGWGTGAYVTASVLRPLGDDDPAPARALGVAHARVNPGDKALAVTVEAPAETDGQAGSVEVTVRVDGLAGEDGYVTLAAVDLGILNLTAHEAPDPTEHYFGQRRLGVELRDLYGRLIDGQSGALGQVRSGGDAGASARFQSPPPTEVPMTFFSGLVPLGPDGTARLTVPKPAFNGTIRLDAVAWSARGVGDASTEVVARDPVVLTASLPRFMAPGDRSRLLLELVHVSGPAGTLPLSINAPNLPLADVPAAATVEPGAKTVLEIPVTADEPGDHALTVTLDLPDGRTLVKTLTLGVRRNDPEVAVTRRFSLAPGETFLFDGEVFAGLRPGTGGATLSAGPLARFDMPGLLAQLDRYPYGCTEQLTSAALPLLYLSEYAPDMDVRPRVQEAIARILTRQSSGGSFGLWQVGAGDVWLDAYVTDFLTRARDGGFDVPDLALKLALDNLRNRVNYAPDFDAGGEGIAYALLVLAQEGAASMADLRYYADVKADAFATPPAVAQVGAALGSYGDTLRADAMFARAAAMLAGQADERVWREDYGTPVSDAAAVLRLASVAGSAVVDRSALAARLTPQRPLSTQEAAQVLLAIDALGQTPSGTGLTVNGAPASGPVVQRLDNPAAGESHAIANIGDQSTDITLTTFGVPEIAPPAGGYGYALTRDYYTPDGEPVGSPVEAGDQLVVVLTITPFEETGARLMLEDPLPAGLEVDNPNLIQSGQIRALEWLKPAPTEHAEFLSDRFRAALEVRGTDPVRVAYKVRAVSPGDYHHPAAMVLDMYRPEYRAITDTGRWQVLP